MAIPYKSNPLPSVSTFPFNINRWGGVNRIKGAQADFEMQNCKNMSSKNYPYASPRLPRDKIADEADIKRIYKVEGERVYYIDGDDCLCFVEDGVKSYITQKESEEKITMQGCSCTNNYDKNTVFYPNMQYIDEESEIYSAKHKMFFTTEYYNTRGKDLIYGTYYNSGFGMKITSKLYIQNVKATNFKITVKFLSERDLTYPTDSEYDTDLKFYVEHYSKDDVKDVKKETQQIIWNYAKDERETEWMLSFNSFEEGDYITLSTAYTYTKDVTLGTTSPPASISTYWSNLSNFVSSGEWYVEQLENTYTGNPCDVPLDYGIVYNNRIVGVHKNQIRASALGDFTNFWEYADEAGNPSATGAYATDVGSAGDFTGICAYNNVLLLFKRDIVYEMYGSMPYTLTELCNTGCIDNDSIKSIDGVLYWASPKGIVRYSGGVPTVISTQVDIKTEKYAKAGTDGRRYYVFDGERTFVYDTYLQMWHIEDDLKIKMFFGVENNIYFVADEGIYKINSGSELVEWEFETKDFSFESETRKNLSKLWIRADMPPRGRLEVFARQDGGKWQRFATKTAERYEMFDFKLKLKKCDSFALKFKGKGDVKILDIHGKVTVGTSKHRSGESLNVYRK